jgi:uncharacterized protein GlcG (DUF336 family)
MIHFASTLNISFVSAFEILSLCQQKAKELGIEISVCIVDNAGNEILFCRMDKAPLLSLSISKKKAFSAVSYSLETGQKWWDFIKSDPILLNSIPQMENFTILGGGKPIFYNNELIGAIGVSGGHYSQDEACIDYALDTLLLQSS